MRLLIEADTALTFEITFEGEVFHLRKTGGEWFLSDGILGGNRNIGGPRIDWIKALARSLAIVSVRP